MNKVNSPIVLVVDDSPDSIGMINSALDEAGYTVSISLNGQQALTITDQMAPDIVLMDAVMPVMDGFECCQRLREKLPYVPIIFMTGLTESEHIIKAFECGSSDYVSKPIQPAELLARIKTHLAQAQLLGDAYDALDSAKQFVLAIDNKGILQWATPGAKEILEHHNNYSELLKSLSREYKQTKESTNLQSQFGEQLLSLGFFKIDARNNLLFKLEQNAAMLDSGKLKESLSITNREAEVLLWVAQGKSNKQIANILKLSPRTVNKHLEQLFPKIKVDNRTAATSIAIKTLLA